MHRLTASPACATSLGRDLPRGVAGPVLDPRSFHLEVLSVGQTGACVCTSHAPPCCCRSQLMPVAWCPPGVGHQGLRGRHPAGGIAPLPRTHRPLEVRAATMHLYYSCPSPAHHAPSASSRRARFLSPSGVHGATVTSVAASGKCGSGPRRGLVVIGQLRVVGL